MDLNSVREFFNSKAQEWDNSKCATEIINTILDYSGIKNGDTVLDVGCGTGIMFPFYFERGVSDITGIDLSEQMIKRAKEKFKDNSIELICSDASCFKYERTFDRIMIYNALPHFIDFKKLLEHLACFLNEGGSLTVAHSLSREKLMECHKNAADVSQVLPEIRDLKELFPDSVEVVFAVSDDEKYIVSGVKK